MNIIGSPAARRHVATQKIATVAQFAQNMDNVKGVDLDPRPDHVEFTAASQNKLPPGLNMTGKASFDNGEVSTMNMTSEQSGVVTDYQVSNDKWEDIRHYEVTTTTPDGQQTQSKANMSLYDGYIIAG